jgi:large subunit ribosomal protein L21
MREPTPSLSGDGGVRRDAGKGWSAVYAIIESGGKQYRVEPGAVLALERLAGDVGSRVELSRVLMVADGEKVQVGHPTVAGVRVVSEIVAQMRGPKIVVFKFKKRKKYRKKTGHRQELTQVKITDIVL